jgi:hypothetical protein
VSLDGENAWESEKGDNELIGALAASVARRRMTTPAILFLELLKPFSFLGSQALLLVEPLLGSPMGRATRRWASLFEDCDNVDRLLGALEEQRRAARPKEEGRCSPS